MIAVHNLSKKFKLYSSPLDRLKERFLGRSCHYTHTALDSVSFHLKAGETLGILGKNGAGKSTLLKLLSGVILPDSGNISIHGRITALLELGTGFDTELTGTDNIRMNGLLMGMSTHEIEEKKENIIAFAELGHYIYEPVKTYSSGMIMRLAFSIAIHADPACFIIDEALSVGDAHFQQKCFRRIREFRQKGGSIIFVSHDMNAVKLICDRAIVLDRGKIIYSGEPDGAVNAYNKILFELDEPIIPQKNESYGSGKLEIEYASIAGSGSGSKMIECGERAHIDIVLKALHKIESAALGIMIRDRFGQDIFGTNTELLGIPLRCEQDQKITCSFEVEMTLSPGKYTLTLAVHNDRDYREECFYWCDNLLQFEIAGIQGEHFAGICRLPTKCQVYSNAKNDIIFTRT